MQVTLEPGEGVPHRRVLEAGRSCLMAKVIGLRSWIAAWICAGLFDARRSAPSRILDRWFVWGVLVFLRALRLPWEGRLVAVHDRFVAARA